MTDSETLQAMRDHWGPAWSIWRARSSSDVGDERTGDWMASRMDDDAGIEPTVMHETAEKLHEALLMQGEKAARSRSVSR